MNLLAQPEDTIYVQHNPADQIEVYDRGWADKRREGCRVYRRRPGEGQYIDITPQVDKATVTRESITIEGRGERVVARHGQESGRGMVSGTVERVESLTGGQ